MHICTFAYAHKHTNRVIASRGFSQVLNRAQPHDAPSVTMHNSRTPCACRLQNLHLPPTSRYLNHPCCSSGSNEPRAPTIIVIWIARRRRVDKSCRRRVDQSIDQHYNVLRILCTIITLCMRLQCQRGGAPSLSPSWRRPPWPVQ